MLVLHKYTLICMTLSCVSGLRIFEEKEMGGNVCLGYIEVLARLIELLNWRNIEVLCHEIWYENLVLVIMKHLMPWNVWNKVELFRIYAILDVSAW